MRHIFTILGKKLSVLQHCTEGRDRLKKRERGHSSSPVDSRGSSVQRQDGWVVDDGAVLGVINYVHGDELGAEGHDVELGTHRLVGVHHLWDGLPLDPPPWELEHRRPVLLCRHR